MFYLVAYDIPNNKRRTKLFKKLKGFGFPVQFSLFECDLDGQLLIRLKEVIGGIAKSGEDNVRIYPLCGDCRKNFFAIDGGVLFRAPELTIV